MAVKAMTLVGLDVHARQTHAAVLDPATGELRCEHAAVRRRWRWCRSWRAWGWGAGGL